jgi:hypothetical protein
MCGRRVVTIVRQRYRFNGEKIESIALRESGSWRDSSSAKLLMDILRRHRVCRCQQRMG